MAKLFATALGFLGGNGLMAGLVVGLIVTVFMWDRGRINAAESRGENNAIQKVEDANENATQKGRSAAGRSGTPARRVSCPQWIKGCASKR